MKLSSLNVDGCLNLLANVCDLASDVNGKMSPILPDPSLEPASGAPSPPIKEINLSSRENVNRKFLEIDKAVSNF